MRWFRRPTDTAEVAPPEAKAQLEGTPQTGFEDYAHEGAPWSPSVTWSSSLEFAAAAGMTWDAAWVYRHQAAVRICVNFLARNVAQLGWKVREHQDEAQPFAPDSDLQTTLDHPNRRTSGFDLKYALMGDMGLYENAYWLVLPGRDQEWELFRVPPAYVTVKGGNILTGPDAYEVDMRTGRPPRTFDPDQIIHFHGYDPLDTRVGQSRLNALTTVLREEYESGRWRLRFWRKGARIGGIVQRPLEAKKWSPDAMERFKNDWKRFTRGGDQEEDTAVLEEGMTYNATSFSPRDAEFIAGREWGLDVTATAYDIPLAMLSRSDSQAFASMKEFHKILYTDVLGPWCAMIERTIALQLVPKFGATNLFVEFNIDEKMQGDFEQQAAAARQSVQVPWQSPNQMAKLRGDPPIGDPNDADNPYNWPARPKNYDYGDPSTAPPPAPPPATVVPVSAGNGHGDVATLTTELEDADAR